MIYSITPRGSATGNGWEYQLERDGHFSNWQPYSNTFSFVTDPEDELSIRTNTTYWLYARNNTLPNVDTIVAAVQVTDDNRVVTVDETGTPRENVSILPGLLGLVNLTSGDDRIGVLAALLSAAQTSQAIADLLCPIVQLGNCGGSQVTLPTFTLGVQQIEKPIVTPTDIIFSGPTTIREGQIIQKDAYLVYSDLSQTKITATGQRQSSAVDLLWDDTGAVLALSNLTEGDTRTATLSITANGITKSQQITIVDSSSIVPNGNYRLTDGSLTEGGAAVQFKLQRQLTDNSWEDYPDPYGLRFQNPFPGLTIDTDGYAQCADDSITQNETRMLEGFIGGSQAYNVTLPSINAAGTGQSFTADSTKQDTLTYSYSGCPATGAYPAVLNYRSTTSAPIARISINGGASFDVQLAATEGVLQDISLNLPLIAGNGTIRIEPIGYFAQHSLQINGTGSVDQVLATTLVPIQNVDPTPDPNTTQLVAYRFIKGGSVAGQPTDYIEVIMKDTYPESPMGIQLWLASASTPTSGYANFEHKLSDGSASTDGNRHAYWQNIGTLANKVFKLGITNLADGNAGNPSLFTFTIITTNANTSGFVQLYPV